jgi:hypothetical protein
VKRPKKPSRKLTDANRLGRRAEGIRWNWKWDKLLFDEGNWCWYGGAGSQVAHAGETLKLSTQDCPIELEAIEWPSGEGNDYEGRIRISDNAIVSMEGFNTRREAQQWAESEVGALSHALKELS